MIAYDVYYARFSTFFRFVCWIATLTLICYWISIYSLNQDLCIIDYKNYYEKPSDVFPILSICIRNPFEKSHFQGKHQDLNETSYVKFLLGEYSSPEFMEMDYNHIRLNLSDYIDNYYIELRNGNTSKHEYFKEHVKLFNPSFSGFWYAPGFPMFYNCYALETPNNSQIIQFSVELRKSMLPSIVKSENYDLLALLHYPGQLLMSYRTIRYWFSSIKPNSTVSMRFQIRQTEVVQRRNKDARPCNDDWHNYDYNIINQHMDNVGCRPPYLGNSTSKVPICSSREQMKNALMMLKSDYGVSPPCRSMEKIYYTYSEGDVSNTVWGNPETFWINILYFNPQFKEILQTR